MPRCEPSRPRSTEDVLDRLDRMSLSQSRSVEWLLDEMFRKRYECRPFLFSELIEQPVLVPRQTWDALLAELVTIGRLTPAEARQAVSSDLVLRGGDPADSVYVIVEVSSIITEQDVQKAAERASLLGRVGLLVRGGVAGQGIRRSALSLAEVLGISRVLELQLDGEDPICDDPDGYGSGGSEASGSRSV